MTLLKLLSAVNSIAAQLRCGTVGLGQGLDSRGAVEAAVLLEHRLNLSTYNSVLGRPLPRRLQPPGVVLAAGHAQLPAQTARGEDPPGRGSGKTSWRQLLFRKARCRQPEKSLGPELAILLAEPVQLGTLLGGDLALVPGDSSITIDPGLTDPAGQAAGGKAEPMGDGSAGEAFLEAEIGGLLLLERREPAPSLGWGGHRWTVWWSWRDPY